MAEQMVKMRMNTTVAGPRGVCEPFNPKKKKNQYYECPLSEAKTIADREFGEIVEEKIPAESEDFSRKNAAMRNTVVEGGPETASIAPPMGRKRAPREGDEA